jgi:hypothetical protein
LYCNLPEDVDFLEWYLSENKIQMALLDDGHHPDIVTQEVLACYNAGVEFIAIHDTNTITHACLHRIRKLYKLVYGIGNYNGLMFYVRNRGNVK